MIDLDTILSAIRKKDIPLSMAVELASSWNTIWAKEKDPWLLLRILSSTGAVISAELAIESAEAAENYFNLHDVPAGWAEKARAEMHKEDKTLSFHDLRQKMCSLADYNKKIRSISDALYAICYAMHAAEYRHTDSIDDAIVRADMAFKSYAKDEFMAGIVENEGITSKRGAAAYLKYEELTSKIPNLIRLRFEQPTIQQIVTAARARR